MIKKYRLVFLAFAVLIGLFLRVFKITSNYYFTGELGKELLYIRQFAMSQVVPLTGMATSHEWLSYGPIYYWVMIPIFNIFNGDPFILFWSGLVVAVLGLVLSYFVVKKIAGEKIALFSTIIQAISPLLIWQTRLSKLHVFFWIIIPIFTYLLYLLWNGKKKWVFWAGLTFGILFSFHFSQIPLLGVVGLLFLIRRHATHDKKDLYKIKDWLIFLGGVFIPNITLIWQDRNLALWIPYRVINFADKNPAGTWTALMEYFGKNIFWDNRLWITGLILFLFLFVHYIYTNKNRWGKDFLPFYLVSSVSLTLAANILHSAPPVHYFLPIFTIVPVLFAIYLSKIKLWPLIVTPILFINLISFRQDPLFYGKVDSLVPNIDMVSYSTQNIMTSFIVSSAKGNTFSIRRSGPYDYFSEEYSQNYKYLILWKGGNLVENSDNIYKIRENTEDKTISIQK